MPRISDSKREKAFMNIISTGAEVGPDNLPAKIL
jgi:hypothetical protein